MGKEIEPGVKIIIAYVAALALWQAVIYLMG